MVTRSRSALSWVLPRGARSAFVTILGAIALIGGTSKSVPPVFLGTWAHGSCANVADRLVIGPATARFNTMRPAAIYYDSFGDGAGHGAIHWDREYVVDNFVYVRENDVLIHNTQGFHMPGAVRYKRCSPRPR